VATLTLRDLTGAVGGQRDQESHKRLAVMSVGDVPFSSRAHYDACGRRVFDTL